jgi:predicted DNA-binding protein (MmcQ/YjbR family)
MKARVMARKASKSSMSHRAGRSGPSKSSDSALKGLRAFGLAYPGAHTKSPWPGHLDLAVNDKTFAYLSIEGEPFGISCKLPHSCAMALNLPFTQPTPYGLGKSGWVSATPPTSKPIPVDLFKAWIDESYRAQAPKLLVKLLPASESGPPPVASTGSTRTRVRTKSAARRTARRASRRSR